MTHLQPYSWNFDDIKWTNNDFLGRGTNAAVYKATLVPSGKVVAVKVLQEDPKDEEEVEMLKTLHHPNIIEIYSAGSWKDQYIIVMEYCSEGSLGDYLQEKAPNGLDDLNFLALLECLRNSLEYMKQKSIIHRDIKPLNICIHKDEEGQLVYKLIDFGCARPFKEGEKWSSSNAYVAGTPMYWHPRINLKSLEKSASVSTLPKDYIDLWSIGVTLFVGATGQMAFQPQPCKTTYQRVNKLHQAFELKREGVICMIERENSAWEQLKELPCSVRISPTLAKLVTPVIAGLMEKDRSKMLTAEMFIHKCDEIIQQTTGVPARRGAQTSEAMYPTMQYALLDVKDKQTVQSPTLFSHLDDAEKAINLLHSKMMKVGLHNDPDYLIVKSYLNQQ